MAAMTALSVLSDCENVAGATETVNAQLRSWERAAWDDRDRSPAPILFVEHESRVTALRPVVDLHGRGVTSLEYAEDPQRDGSHSLVIARAGLVDIAL